MSPREDRAERISHLIALANRGKSCFPSGERKFAHAEAGINAIAVLEVLVDAIAGVVEVSESCLRRKLSAPVAGLQARRSKVRLGIEVILGLLRDGADPAGRDN